MPRRTGLALEPDWTFRPDTSFTNMLLSFFLYNPVIKSQVGNLERRMTCVVGES